MWGEAAAIVGDGGAGGRCVTVGYRFVSWDVVCSGEGVVMARDSDTTAADKAAAVTRVRAALAAEKEVRAAWDEAQQRTAAALAVARMARVPWAALTAGTGLSRPAILKRINRFSHGGQLPSHYALPAQITTPHRVADSDDGRGDQPPLWWEETVQASVEHAVSWVQQQVRDQMPADADPVSVLAAIRAATEAAGRAALSGVRDVAASSEPSVRRAAVVAAQAAAAVATQPQSGDRR